MYSLSLRTSYCLIRWACGNLENGGRNLKKFHQFHRDNTVRLGKPAAIHLLVGTLICKSSLTRQGRLAHLYYRSNHHACLWLASWDWAHDFSPMCAVQVFENSAYLHGSLQTCANLVSVNAHRSICMPNGYLGLSQFFTISWTWFLKEPHPSSCLQCSTSQPLQSPILSFYNLKWRWGWRQFTKSLIFAKVLRT